MPAPSIPEAAPQFRGEKGKDDLHDWVNQSKLWFARTALLNKGNNSITEVDLVDIFCLTAFKAETPARYWYEANRAEIIAPPSSGKPLHEQLLEAVEEHFAHLVADPDQELIDLRLHGMDLSTFAHKFLKVYKASSTSSKKAKAMLLLKCEKLKELHSRLLSMCVEQPKITVEQLVDYMHKHQALVNTMECIDPAKTRKVVGMTVEADASPTPASCTTQAVQPPAKTNQARNFCMLHGHNPSHNTEQCRDLQAMVSDKKAVNPRAKPSRPADPQDQSNMAGAVTQEVMERLSAVGIGPGAPSRAPATPPFGPYTQKPVPRQEWYPAAQPHSYAPVHMQAQHAGPQTAPAPFYASNMIYPARAGMMFKYPRHEVCGRIHPPDAPCYGRDYDPRVHMRAPPAQPRMPAPAPATQQTKQVHMTRYSAPTTESPDGARCAFAQTPASDHIQPVWPPLHALLTVRTDMDPEPKSSVCAATPVPFRAGPLNRADVPGEAPAPVQKPEPPAMATVRIVGSELSVQDLIAMQKLPGFEVSFKVPKPTLMGALKRTDLLAPEGTPTPSQVSAQTSLAESHTRAASHSVSDGKVATAPEAATSSEPSLFGFDDVPVFAAAKHGPIPEQPTFDTTKYMNESSGLYRLSEGVSFAHREKIITASRVLFDTCSEVNLLSKEFADKNGILYGPSTHKIHTSMGSAGGVIGQVVGPIWSILNRGKDVECSTASPDGVTFLVVAGVNDLYEVLLSTHVARDWGARADPVVNLLQYRPFLRTKNDLDTFASVPLISTGKSQLKTAATAFLACMTTAADKFADPQHDAHTKSSVSTVASHACAAHQVPLTHSCTTASSAAAAIRAWHTTRNKYSRIKDVSLFQFPADRPSHTRAPAYKQQLPLTKHLPYVMRTARTTNQHSRQPPLERPAAPPEIAMKPQPQSWLFAA